MPAATRASLSAAQLRNGGFTEKNAAHRRVMVQITAEPSYALVLSCRPIALEANNPTAGEGAGLVCCSRRDRPRSGVQRARIAFVSLRSAAEAASSCTKSEWLLVRLSLFKFGEVLADFVARCSGHTVDAESTVPMSRTPNARRRAMLSCFCIGKARLFALRRPALRPLSRSHASSVVQRK